MIPTGYMPASVDGGWYLELCPDDMPAHVMQALFGEHHAHHGSGSDSTYFQCDYDSGVTSDAIVQAEFSVVAAAKYASVVEVADTLPAKGRRASAFQSRAPPTTSRFI